MNVSEMKDEDVVYEHGHWCTRYYVDLDSGDVESAKESKALYEKARAELLSRLSRGALAERKLAVAMEALTKIVCKDYDYENVVLSAKTKLEIEAMKE